MMALMVGVTMMNYEGESIAVFPAPRVRCKRCYRTKVVYVHVTPDWVNFHCFSCYHAWWHQREPA